MFVENEFRALLARKGITIEKMAEMLGINTSTLYRKMTGESDFYRKEIQTICDVTHEKNLDYIFFA